MAEKQHADLIVIGAGPGGYAAAFRAADLGRSVVLVDSRPTLGGVCLNEGCIPSKALLHAARVIQEAGQMAGWGISLGKPKIDIEALRERKDAIVSQLTNGLMQLARRRKVRRVTGHAAFAGANELIVTGAQDAGVAGASTRRSSPSARRQMRLPGLAGRTTRIWDSAAALVASLRAAPP